MWKLHNGYIPPPVSNMFNLNTSQVVVRTNPGKYHLPAPRLNYAKRHISYWCVKLWNTEIPHSIKQIKLHKSFAKVYKTHLLNTF